MESNCLPSIFCCKVISTQVAGSHFLHNCLLGSVGACKGQQQGASTQTPGSHAYLDIVCFTPCVHVTTVLRISVIFISMIILLLTRY